MNMGTDSRMDRESEGVITAEFDLDEIAKEEENGACSVTAGQKCIRF